MAEDRKPYTPEEDELIYNSFYDLSKRKELPEKLGRSSAAISFRFYRYILPNHGIKDPKDYYEKMGVAVPSSPYTHGKPRVQRPIPAPAEPHTEEPFAPIEDDHILEGLRNFPDQIQELNNKVEDVDRRMSDLESAMNFYLKEFAVGVTNIGRMMEGRETALSQFKKLQEENVDLKNKLKEARDEAEWNLGEMRRIYGELDFWLGRFMKLSSVDKVATLGDFIPRIKATFDQFGTLVKLASDQT